MLLNRQQTIFLILILLISGIMVVAVYNVFTSQFPGLNDFMSRWEGARSYFVEGLNPYGEEASLNIQQRIFGRPILPDEDPGFFAYPFYTVFAVLPLVYIPYAWASAIWMVLLAGCLLLAFFLLLDFYSWKPKPWLLILLILWMLTAYYPARGLLLGQPGHVVYLLQVVALWALAKDREHLAGVALAISTIKPQMGFLLIPFLLLWGLRSKRAHFIRAFSLAFGILMVVSFILMPSWLSDWLNQLSLYPTYTIGGPVWILSNLPWLEVRDVASVWTPIGGFGDTLRPILDIFFYALLLWSWYGILVQQKSERFLWTVMMTLTLTHLVAPRTATPHFVVFIIPMIFYLRLLAKRVKNGNLWILVALMIVLIVPWVHHSAMVIGNFEHPTLFLPAPFGMVALLWFTRKTWWDEPEIIQSGAR